MAANSNSFYFDCDLCAKQVAIYFCKQCNQTMCDNCKLIHKRGRLTSRHNVSVDVNRNCPEHGETLKLFCRSCVKEICKKCLTRNHKDHNISLNKDMILRLRCAGRYATDVLKYARNIELKMKEKNELFLKQHLLINGEVKGDVLNCNSQFEEEVDNVKKEREIIEVWNKMRCQNIRKTVNEYENITRELKNALLLCNNGDVLQNPQQTIKILENVNLLYQSEYSLKSLAESFREAFETLEFLFPCMKYNPPERFTISGTTVRSDDEKKLEIAKSGDVSTDDSGSNVEAQKAADAKKSNVIFEMESRHGHKVALISGDATCIRSDVVINFLTCRMDVDFKDSSKLIMKRAGKSVEEEAKEKFSQSGLRILVTGGGSLGSKSIVHVVLPAHLQIDSSDKKALVKNAVYDAVARSLRSAEPNSRTITISIPLDCSSTFGDLSHCVASLLFESVTCCLGSFVDSGIVARVDLVGRDETNLKVVAASADQLIKESMNLGSFEMLYAGGMKLELHVGSILDEEVDAMLISVHPSLDLNRGRISSQLLHMAGHEIQQECSSRKPPQFYPGELIVTGGYKSKSKCVFHGLVGHDGNIDFLDNIKQLLHNAINMSLHLGISSLALPAIGTGIGLPAHMAAALTFEVLHGFGIHHSSGRSLRRIVIVLHPDDTAVVQTFTDYIQALNPLLKKPLWTIVFQGSGCDKMKAATPKSSPNGKEGNDVNDRLASLSVSKISPQDEDKTVSNGPKNVSPPQKTVWCYREAGSWVDYPEKLNAMLERNFLARKPGTTWKENEEIYRVTYSVMKEEVDGVEDAVDVDRRTVDM